MTQIAGWTWAVTWCEFRFIGLYVYRIPQQMMKYLPLCTLCEPNFHTSIITLNWGQWLVPPPISYHQPSCDHLSKQGDAGVLSEKRLPQKSNGFSWLSSFSIFKWPFMAGWWFQPLWKIWVRQLGLWHSQLNGKIIQMFQTTNQL